MNHFITQRERTIRIIENTTHSDYINIEKKDWIQGNNIKYFSSRVYAETHLVHLQLDSSTIIFNTKKFCVNLIRELDQNVINMES